MRWTDIPGITRVDGQLRLPTRPAVVVHLFALAVEGGGRGLKLHELVDRVVKDTGEDRARVEGLAGWLPLSRVAAWDADTGELVLDPTTDIQDLGLRYAAWIGSQGVPATALEQVKDYARGIVEEAVLVARTAPRRKVEAGALEEPRADVPAPAEEPEEEPLVDPDLTLRLRSLVAALDRSFVERRKHTRASMLALLAGQHVLLLGPPGTGKSMLARALCRCFRTGEAGQARYFEYLLSKFTHPDELFGPVSIPGLKDEDYRRITQGFLPDAHVAFLDEIFKANSAILNSLLTLVNERVFHHGRHRDQVPLIGLVGASNELPDPNSGLAALWDRFLVRLTVPPISEEPAFLSVATGTIAAPDIPLEVTIGPGELAILRAAADKVEVPRTVEEALVSLWKRGARLEWSVSDRRWRQAVAMLKLGAAADGRRRLVMLDLLLLEPVLAPEPDRAIEIREAILEHLGSHQIPQHDLRAQWTLLQADRVAPTQGDPTMPANGPGWRERVARRQTSIRRLLVHHQQAVERLANDRQRLERQGERHLWLEALPVQLLSSHIEAARDLARILQVAEAYRDALEGPPRIAAALLAALPQGSRRVYGHDAVCALAIADAGLNIGLTLAGECVPFDATGGEPNRGVTLPSGPVLTISAVQFLDWVEGRLGTEALLAKVPAWSARNAATALESTRRLFGGDVVPKPPELPAP